MVNFLTLLSTICLISNIGSMIVACNPEVPEQVKENLSAKLMGPALKVYIPVDKQTITEKTAVVTEYLIRHGIDAKDVDIKYENSKYKISATPDGKYAGEVTLSSLKIQRELDFKINTIIEMKVHVASLKIYIPATTTSNIDKNTIVAAYLMAHDIDIKEVDVKAEAGSYMIYSVPDGKYTGAVALVPIKVQEELSAKLYGPALKVYIPDETISVDDKKFFIELHVQSYDIDLDDVAISVPDNDGNYIISAKSYGKYMGTVTISLTSTKENLSAKLMGPTLKIYIPPTKDLWERDILVSEYLRRHNIDDVDINIAYIYDKNQSYILSLSSKTDGKYEPQKITLLPIKNQINLASILKDNITVYYPGGGDVNAKKAVIKFLRNNNIDANDLIIKLDPEGNYTLTPITNGKYNGKTVTLEIKPLAKSLMVYT